MSALTGLAITFLGAPMVAYGGAPLKFATRKALALFAYLLVENGLHTRGKLETLLWPESDAHLAQSALRNTLARLREALQPAGVPLLLERDRIGFDHSARYALDLSVITEAVASLSRGLGESAATLTALTSAAHAARGPFLEGFSLPDAPEFDSWSEIQRSVWRHHLDQVYDRLSLLQAEARQLPQAIQTVERWISQDSLNEPAYQRLIQLHFANGDRAAAQRSYEICKAVLARDLGVAPSPATEAALARARAAPPARAARAEPAAPPAQHNRPREVTSVVGRAAEIAPLIEQLVDPAQALITLTGESGGGKTRLALAAARILLERRPTAFIDGVWFVSLDDAVAGGGPPDREALALRIGNALQLAIQGGQKPSAQILAWLKDKDCLLILDDFERYLDTDAVDFLVELLPLAARLHVLVTSRVALDLNSESVFRVSGLPVPDDPQAAAAADSVRLFADRAARAGGSFDLDGQLPDVIAICRWVGGLPLGIKLAAAHAASLPCADILRALQTNLDLLASARRDIPPRQRSMRAILEYTWARMDSDERTLLSQLAVFEGGFSREAARAVLGEAAEALDRLARQALLLPASEQRFTMHDMVRQFARERGGVTDNGETQHLEAADRHSAFYLRLWQSHEQSLRQINAKIVVRVLRQDERNLALAWQRAVTQERWEDIAGGLDGLLVYIDRSNVFHAGRGWVLSALERIPDTIKRQRALRGRLLVALASLDGNLGLYDEASTSAEQAAALAQALGERVIETRADLTWAHLLYQRGAFPAALEKYQHALGLSREAGEARLEGDALWGIGWMQLQMEDYAPAQEPLEQALSRHRAIQDAYGEMLGLTSLGVLARRRNRLDESEGWYEQALTLCQTLGDRHFEGKLLSNLGVVARMRCHFGAAETRLEASLALLKQLGLPPNVEIVLGELGLLALALGDIGLARARLDEALTIARSIGDRYGQSGFASNLSEVAHARGDNETALALARQGLAIALADANTSLQAIALVAEGDALLGLGRLDEAEAGYRTAGAVYAGQRRALPRLGPQTGLVEVALRRGDPAEARARAEEILGVLADDAATAACAPAAVYWACWQALSADRDPRAGALLAQARALLRARSLTIPDADARARYAAQAAVGWALGVGA